MDSGFRYAQIRMKAGMQQRTDGITTPQMVLHNSGDIAGFDATVPDFIRGNPNGGANAALAQTSGCFDRHPWNGFSRLERGQDLG